MSSEGVFYLGVDEITPDPEQPRKTFSEEDLKSLAQTMETQDIINPIEVDSSHVIVTGERRWRSAIIAGLEVVPCKRWEGTAEKRFERQLIENLNHRTLTEGDRDKAIAKLWETGNYNPMEALAKTVGLDRGAVNNIIEAQAFRIKHSVDDTSTYAIRATRGLSDDTRKEVLEATKKGMVKVRELEDVKKVAQSSPELLEKVLEGEISVDRALDVAETIKKIEAKGVTLAPEQKQRLADNVAKDETLLEKYEDDVLARVHKAMTTPKSEQEPPTGPVGRTSPVNYIIAVKDTIQNSFKRHIGNCDVKERKWALRVLVEIQEEIEHLIEVVSK